MKKSSETVHHMIWIALHIKIRGLLILELSMAIFTRAFNRRL